MALKMLFLAFSVLLIAKETFGKIDCETFCESREILNDIPRNVPAFKDYCGAVKSHLKCLKRWQDDCAPGRFFKSPEMFDEFYGVSSEICEEGTLLNTVAIENLECFNETFSKTRCSAEAHELRESLMKKDNEVSESRFFECLLDTHVYDCALRAISDNCGRLAWEASLEYFRRTKVQENSCTEQEAKSVLDELDNLDLSEDKKRSMAQLLEKFLEEIND